MKSKIFSVGSNVATATKRLPKKRQASKRSRPPTPRHPSGRPTKKPTRKRRRKPISSIRRVF